ncbi:MAG: sugar phosphate isomerase/epimerase [Bacteroidota bacterium]
MDRRRFLRRSSAALTAAALLGPTALRAQAAARAAGVPERLGIQLYTLRDILPGDVNGVFEMLARFGYTDVETAGYHDRSPEVFAAVLDAHGLAAPSAHTLLSEITTGIPSMAEADFPDLDTALQHCQTLGHEYLVIPWLPPDGRPDRDGYLALADQLNRLGERAREAGVTLGYHNHEFEFETFGTDRPAYFDFVERLDPDLIVMELDLYWVQFAGYDPVEVFERYPGRFPLWHVKDGAGEDMAQTVVGQGSLDFEAIFAASATAGLRHAIIEADNPADSLAFAEASIEYVESLRD